MISMPVTRMIPPASTASIDLATIVEFASDFAVAVAVAAIRDHPGVHKPSPALSTPKLRRPSDHCLPNPSS